MSLSCYLAAYATNSYLENSSKALRFTRLSPSDFDRSGAPVTLNMEILVATGGKGTKRKSAASTTGEGAKKKQKKNQASRRSVTASDQADDDEEAAFNEVEGEDAEDYPVNGEDAAFSSRENGSLLSSDEVVDEDGWSRIVKNPSVSNGSFEKKKPIEVLELD